MTRARGFSLIETLVTISILAILVSIVAPMLAGAYRKGEHSKLRADLNTITIALEAYKAEHGHYPRFTPGDPDVQTDRGARRLFTALFGQYLTADDFKILGPADAQVLADTNGNPILYYPAHPVRHDLTQRHAYLASYDPHTGIETQTGEQLRRASLFNAYDNAAFMPKNALMKLLDAAASGDALGGIGGNRMTPKYSGAYLLISAGVDGEFGTDDDIQVVGGGQPPMARMSGALLAMRDDQSAPQYAAAPDWSIPTEVIDVPDSDFILPPKYQRVPPTAETPDIPAPRPSVAPADAINIMDFGANPNDGVDDTDAIRKAIEEAAKQGKAVVFPPGEFDISKTIELRPGGSYYGPGLVRFNGGSGSALKLPGDAGDIYIDGLTFIGRGIQFHSKHNNVTIVNSVFKDINGGSHGERSAIYANGGLTNSLIQNNQFINVSRDAIWINTTADRTRIDSNYFQTVHQAMHVISNGGRDIQFTNNVGVGLERMGIEFQGHDAVDALIQGNTFKDWRQDLVYHGSFALSIMNKGTGIKVLDNQLFGFGNNPVGIEFASHSGVVAGNVVSGFREGMHVTWGHNIQVQGNHFIGQTWMSIWFVGYEKVGVHNTRVTGNKFTYPKNVLVFMGSGANGTVVEGNEARLSGGADFVQSHGSNATAGVTIGANTVIRD